jgi:hypothetical protein
MGMNELNEWLNTRDEDKKKKKKKTVKWLKCGMQFQKFEIHQIFLPLISLKNYKRNNGNIAYTQEWKYVVHPRTWAGQAYAHKLIRKMGESKITLKTCFDVLLGNGILLGF